MLNYNQIKNFKAKIYFVHSIYLAKPFAGLKLSGYIAICSHWPSDYQLTDDFATTWDLTVI